MFLRGSEVLRSVEASRRTPSPPSSLILLLFYQLSVTFSLLACYIQSFFVWFTIAYSVDSCSNKYENVWRRGREKREGNGEGEKGRKRRE